MLPSRQKSGSTSDREERPERPPWRVAFVFIRDQLRKPAILQIKYGLTRKP